MKDTDFDQSQINQYVRKHGSRTRKAVFFRLRKQDYIGGLASDLDKAAKTVRYHIQKLLEDGLVEQVGEKNRKKYYQTTPEGDRVLREMNKPNLDGIEL